MCPLLGTVTTTSYCDTSLLKRQYEVSSKYLIRRHGDQSNDKFSICQPYTRTSTILLPEFQHDYRGRNQTLLDGRSLNQQQFLFFSKFMRNYRKQVDNSKYKSYI
uniref:Uncharacterized protein n=1 Tax=Oryza brachyantha TaxID=4533 RepID=J3MFI2_ORYBR